MTRSELIAAMQKRYSDLPKDTVDQGVRLVIERLAQAIVNSERIEVRNFGSFTVRPRSARIGHNPRTGKKIFIAPSAKIHFKPSLSLRRKVASLPVDDA